MPRRVLVRPVVEEDWREVRDQRLEMLADTPIAYLETLANARRVDERGWRSRARPAARGIRFTAIDPRSGEWVGTMGGVLGSGAHRGPLLVGVWVRPEWRGRSAGVTDALLDAVEGWAREHGDTIALEVHEDNDRAIAAYENRGWRRTGETVPYPLDPSKRELVMVKRLS